MNSSGTQNRNQSDMDRNNRMDEEAVYFEDSLDFTHYFYLLNRSKWHILSLTLVVTLLSVLVAYQITPLYEGTATLLVESPSGKVVAIDEIYGLDTTDRNFLQTQIKLIESREMANKVVSDPRFSFNRDSLFKLPEADSKSGFSPASWLSAEAPAMSQSEVSQLVLRQRIDILRIGLSATNIRGTNLIQISFRSPDRQLAKDIPNAVAEAYIESQLEARMQVTEKAAGWLGNKLEELRQKLAASEEALQQFQETENLVASKGGSVRDSGLNELQSIEDELNRQRTERLELEQLVLEFESMAPQAMDSLASHPYIMTLENVKEAGKVLDDAKRQVIALSERYGPKHPKMITAQTALADARQQLELQISIGIGNARKKLRAMEANETGLLSAQEQARQGLQGISRKEFQLAELKRNVETDRQLYQTFFTRFKETDATEGLYAASARLSDPAVMPLVPVAPNKTRIVVMTAMLSFMLAFFIVWLRDYLNNSLRTPQDVEKYLAVNVLGFLPLLGKEALDAVVPGKGFYEQADLNFYTESLRTVRSSFILSQLQEDKSVIAITSSLPGEGKSTLAYNLSKAMAQHEKVLLIDADMRKPAISSLHGLKRETQGLTDLMAGNIDPGNAIQHNASGLDVLPAGKAISNPLILISSARFSELVAQLRQQYDCIVFDSPPIQAVSDALLLSKLCSSVIYVIKANKTTRQVAKLGLKRIMEAGGRVAGVVLNEFDLEEERKYHYRDGYHSYDDSYYSSNSSSS